VLPRTPNDLGPSPTTNDIQPTGHQADVNALDDWFERKHQQYVDIRHQYGDGLFGSTVANASNVGGAVLEAAQPGGFLETVLLAVGGPFAAAREAEAQHRTELFEPLPYEKGAVEPIEPLPLDTRGMTVRLQNGQASRYSVPGSPYEVANKDELLRLLEKDPRLEPVQREAIAAAAASAWNLRAGASAGSSGLNVGRLASPVGALPEVKVAELKACFAAGTPLLTPNGSRAVEEFRRGDELLSRSEFDPGGPVASRRVEKVFVRTARVLHLHVGRQVIRTTAEHPLYVGGRGWVPAGELQPGDCLLSHDGQWVSVEECFDTGLYERVYNVQIEEYHTYFVGRPDWGFSVWAHNAECHLANFFRALQIPEDVAVQLARTGMDVLQREGKEALEDFLKEVGKQPQYRSIGLYGRVGAVKERQNAVAAAVKLALEAPIYGQLNSTASKTPGHSEVAYQEATVLSKSGRYREVYLGMGWKTATGVEVSGRELPDIIAIRNDGTVDAYEVESKTDNAWALLNRIQKRMAELPPERQGTTTVLRPEGIQKDVTAASSNGKHLGKASADADQAFENHLPGFKVVNWK
jgi:hypothetical protein